MIVKHPFGSTGHLSTCVIFGAAALGAMKQDKADTILDLLLELKQRLGMAILLIF